MVLAGIWLSFTLSRINNNLIPLYKLFPNSNKMWTPHAFFKADIWSNSYDLVKFIKLIKQAGVYAHLRIGENWGFPVWLKYVPGIAKSNMPNPICHKFSSKYHVMAAMDKFTWHIVNIMKAKRWYETEGEMKSEEDCIHNEEFQSMVDDSDSDSVGGDGEAYGEEETRQFSNKKRRLSNHKV
uniref:Beta-galactosidase n=1 Tax=Lactuca sativa TaxID=4236 RepID=A0A9R1VKQ2_LACSA|nr:hypothetical protein LSAT_V11C500272990 [Lactuca sativa]